jgi:hypothetical protein
MISQPAAPKPVQTIKNGWDALRVYIPASKKVQQKRSLLVVSSEGDGSVKVLRFDLN